MRFIHIKYLLFLIGLILFSFLFIGNIIFNSIKPIVLKSGFRISVAGAGLKTINNNNFYIFVGDSRIMDGFNAYLANKSSRSKFFTYNFAFNGVEFRDSIFIIKNIIKSTNCKIKRVYINAQVFEKETEEKSSDLQVFLTSFDRSLIDELSKKSIFYKLSLKLFPLISYNNEHFLRSIWYYMKGTSDQDAGNDYKFKVHETMLARLNKEMPKHNKLDVGYIDEIIKLTQSNNIELIVIYPPVHGKYIQNRLNFAGYIDELHSVFSIHNIRFYDHSSLFQSNDDYFSDLMHLNKNGQSEYTNFLTNNFLLN